MFYPARWKKITVDQSKVLENWLFRFLGPPGNGGIGLKCKFMYVGHICLLFNLCIFDIWIMIMEIQISVINTRTFSIH